MVVKDIPIICPHCKKESGYTRQGLMHLVITSDLPCKECGKVVISTNNGIVW